MCIRDSPPVVLFAKLADPSTTEVRTFHLPPDYTESTRKVCTFSKQGELVGDATLPATSFRCTKEKVLSAAQLRFLLTVFSSITMKASQLITFTQKTSQSVSYTHLTLPTNYSV
eukprot:TRINITY_DN15808_c0_g1_i1.p1 TRINITY_DN15808_c0_g1~~TRINITY_DN15808_c0_g1_i1.p1  ORF type:complete len:114 (+),score=20.15 TRINITY_DN15808_c0_g1_i1:49-390(+)